MNVCHENDFGDNGTGHAQQLRVWNFGKVLPAAAFWRISARLKPILSKYLATLALLVSTSSQAAFTTNADLAIGKTANPTGTVVGSNVVFTIGITNLGIYTANNITGSDLVPGGFSVFAWSSFGSPSAPVYNPTNGVWTLASLGPGVTASLIISATATN